MQLTGVKLIVYTGELPPCMARVAIVDMRRNVGAFREVLPAEEKTCQFRQTPGQGL